MPIFEVQITTFKSKPSEDEIKASYTIQNFSETLKKYDGIIRYILFIFGSSRIKFELFFFSTSAWHGLKLEDPAQYNIFVIWDSVESQLAAASQNYSSLSTTLSAVESSLQRLIFDISQSPDPAFAAPVTDVTLMTLQKDQAVDPQVNVAKFAALPTGAQGVYWGQSKEIQELSITLIGWNSIKVESSLFFFFTCSSYSHS